MFQKLKDAASVMAASSYLQSKLGDAGKIQNLNLNSLEKTISLSLLLTGEESPLTVNIEKYSITPLSSSHHLFRIEQFSSNKPWLNSIFASYLSDRGFSIPSTVGMML